MKKVEFRIHWLSVTVHASVRDAAELHKSLFRELFGDLQALGHGGRGYREIQKGLLNYKIYSVPINPDQEHFHLEIPGVACDAIPLPRYQALFDYLEIYFPKLYNFKRLDLAFDHVGFTPEQASIEIQANRIRTLAKRETFKIYQSPYKLRDDGQIGTHTIEIGSDQSERKLTIYNKRGYTRLEFQIKNDRAIAVAPSLFNNPEFDKWAQVVIQHLRDYIDFEASWWTDFVNSQPRANQKITTPKERTIEKSIEWLDTQVAPTLSIVEDATGGGFTEILLKRGRNRRKAQDNFLLED